jgi:hypothetical protein
MRGVFFSTWQRYGEEVVDHRVDLLGYLQLAEVAGAHLTFV